MPGFAHPKRPIQDALGIGALRAADLKWSEPPPQQRSLAGFFPGQRTYQCGFDAITVPAGLSAPTAGNCFLYGLRRFVIGTDIEAEGVLIGAFFDLLPTDYNGYGWTSTAASASAWGDVRGAKARIVVGFNMKQMSVGAFNVVKTPTPGIESGTYAVPTGAPEPQFIFSMGFPPGSFNDTLPQRLYAPRSLAPAAQRLTRGGTLDVGILFNGAQIAAASAGTPKVLHGFAHIQLHVATLTNDLDLH